jgi:hypothetical protein
MDVIDDGLASKTSLSVNAGSTDTYERMLPATAAKPNALGASRYIVSRVPTSEVTLLTAICRPDHRPPVTAAAFSDGVLSARTGSVIVVDLIPLLHVVNQA